MNDRSPFDLREIIESLAEAGQRLCEMGASEGASGNMSVCLLGPSTPHPDYSIVETLDLPLCVPELAGATIVVTGSSTRSRDIRADPGSSLAILEVLADGARATLHCSPRRKFSRVTSEFNSHLAVHDDQVRRSTTGYHAIVHGQPRRLTYLSHIAEYQNEEYLNRRLLRWQPETVLNLPEGIASVPFLIPSSPELMHANLQALRERRAAIWAKHGVMTRSSASLAAAVDLVDYLETAATYECTDLALGQRAQGLDDADLDSVCLAYGVERAR